MNWINFRDNIKNISHENAHERKNIMELDKYYQHNTAHGVPEVQIRLL